MPPGHERDACESSGLIRQSFSANLGPTSGVTQMMDIFNIRERSHQLWEAAGKPEGQEQRFWHEAERQLKEEQIREEQFREEHIREEQIKIRNAG
jgi:hypothetical protein